MSSQQERLQGRVLQEENRYHPDETGSQQDQDQLLTVVWDE